MSKTASTFRLSLSHFLSRWLLYPLCYRIVRYRRKVVRANLRTAFPESTPRDIRRLERSFYLNFTDMVMEVLVGLRLSEEDMRRFVVINGKEEAADRCKRHGGMFFMLGHFLNWEWIVDYANQFADLGVECGTVYKKLNNSFFDRLMLRIRSRRGGFMVEMRQLLRVMASRRNNPALSPAAYAMLADQRPRRSAAQCRTVFLNRRLGVLAGTEQLALRFRYPVYYVNFHSHGRGHYEVSLVNIYDPDRDANLPFGTVTERFARLLEDNIRREPDRWLWSHRRFAGSSSADDNIASI